MYLSFAIGTMHVNEWFWLKIGQYIVLLLLLEGSD